jgi:hypothetical protein
MHICTVHTYIVNVSWGEGGPTCWIPPKTDDGWSRCCQQAVAKTSKSAQPVLTGITDGKGETCNEGGDCTAACCWWGMHKALTITKPSATRGILTPGSCPNKIDAAGIGARCRPMGDQAGGPYLTPSTSDRHRRSVGRGQNTDDLPS